MLSVWNANNSEYDFDVNDDSGKYIEEELNLVFFLIFNLFK
jgi:hypothetical protein